MAATSIMLNPFSNRREMASCRRSWNFKSSRSHAIRTFLKRLAMLPFRISNTYRPGLTGSVRRAAAAARDRGDHAGRSVLCIGEICNLAVQVEVWPGERGYLTASHRGFHRNDYGGLEPMVFISLAPRDYLVELPGRSRRSLTFPCLILRMAFLGFRTSS